MTDLLKELLGASIGGFHTLTGPQWFDLGVQVAMVAPEFIKDPKNLSRETRLKLDDVIVKFEKEVGLV